MMNSLNIPVRRPQYNFAEVARYFYANNPLLSAVFTALSLTFPVGERFFVHSVRNVRKQVTNESLQQQISGFIGQEAMHSQAHQNLNDYFESLDIDSQKVLQQEEQVTLWAKSNLSQKQQLAITCALEHFTAILAKYLLEHPNFSAKFDSNIQHLWLWHALEETEHKAVAFDVYQTVFADQNVRKLFMGLITCSFFIRITQLSLQILVKDPHGRKQWQQHWQALKILKQVMANILPEYLAYYDNKFHPNQFDTTELSQKWQQQLFASEVSYS